MLDDLIPVPRKVETNRIDLAAPQLLIEEPSHELTVGAIGKVWQLDIPFVHVEGPEAYARFAQPGWVKVAWSLRVEPRGDAATRVVFEVRVDATDDRFLKIFSTKGAEKRKQHGSKGAAVFRDP